MEGDQEGMHYSHSTHFSVAQPPPPPLCTGRPIILMCTGHFHKAVLYLTPFWLAFDTASYGMPMCNILSTH